MAGLGRSYALQLANERAKAQQGQDLQWDAETFAHGLFDNVWIDDKAIDSWSHVATPELIGSIGKFGINRQDLRAVAEEYIEHKGWLHNRHFDWLLADLLVYAELSGFMLHVNKRLHFNYSTGARVGSIIAVGAWRLLMWLLWLAILIAAFLWSPAVGWVLVGLTVVHRAARFMQRRKQAKLVQSMIDVYGAFDGKSLSWAVVWELLAKSRALGAVWDPELYALVESRMATCLVSLSANGRPP
jgi:hypothetical protein